ncbi:hypothetical protein IM697_18570 [Streptomyces ferrugineus]|uniref:Uncharacterized protein n=1 Tax=Streptomyces ferrugineus TaxID=1413221 RepID=A0A7M2SV58_9ACTN|nr:hypothetical protein [Streptomyces ferrugineus]QOV40227.1 hypothetical protein IM697_18570 [Streptomyces ferrugineus]
MPLMAITADLAAAQLPNGIEHSLVRVTPAWQIRGGDLLVGIDDGPLTHTADLRSARPFTRPRYALTQPLHALARDTGTITLDGRNYTTKPDDLVLYVPAAWCPMAYEPEQRVERIAWHTPAWGYDRTPRRYIQRGTLRRVAPDGLVAVQWDGYEETFLTGRDLVRPVDPADIAQEREESGGYAVGDRVTFGQGPSVGLVLDLYRPSFYGPFRARVLWDGTPDTAPREDTISADQLNVTTPTEA